MSFNKNIFLASNEPLILRSLFWKCDVYVVKYIVLSHIQLPAELLWFKTGEISGFNIELNNSNCIIIIIINI
jgi:hypothetical protein